MLIHELTPAECREVLGRTSLARLACARAGQPYVVPVSFAYDPASNCLFGFSAVGSKVDWMRENPHVCVEVEDVSDRLLRLPFYNSLTEAEQEQVVDAIREFYRGVRTPAYALTARA